MNLYLFLSLEDTCNALLIWHNFYRIIVIFYFFMNNSLFIVSISSQLHFDLHMSIAIFFFFNGDVQAAFPFQGLWYMAQTTFMLLPHFSTIKWYIYTYLNVTFIYCHLHLTAVWRIIYLNIWQKRFLHKKWQENFMPLFHESLLFICQFFFLILILVNVCRNAGFPFVKPWPSGNESLTFIIKLILCTF